VYETVQTGKHVNNHALSIGGFKYVFKVRSGEPLKITHKR